MTPKKTSLLLLSISLTFPTSSIGAIEFPQVKEPKPIDVIQQQEIKSHRSKEARLLQRCEDALKKNKWPLAFALAEKLAKTSSFSDYSLWIRATSQFKQAQIQIEKKKYSLARRFAEKSRNLSEQIGKNPYSPFFNTYDKDIANAQLITADTYYFQKQWNLAQQNFESAFQRLTQQSNLNEIDFNAVSHYLGSCEHRPSLFCQSWFVKFSLQAKKKPKEMKTLMEFAPDTFLPPNSIPAPGKSQPYKSPDQDQIAFEAALQAYLGEEYSRSTQLLEKFLTDFSRSTYKQRAQYWLAQSYAQKKDEQKSNKTLTQLQSESPLTYYGLLASFLTRKPIETQFNANFPLGVESDIALLPSEVFHLKRAQSFVAEKAFSFAAIELKEIKVRDTFSSPFLIYFASLNARAHYHLGVFQALGELIQRKDEGIFTSYCLRLIFPDPFDDVIRKYAVENNLDPILVFSLIKQESAFAEEARSSSGALGLMQLMPATALDTDPKIQISDLTTPEQNVRIGTLYLKKLLTRFNGNIALALAGYNAGPTAVQRWLKDTPSNRRLLEFIESIPYKETREYVAGIIRNYYWYSQQFEGRFDKTLDYFWYPYGPQALPKNLPTPTLTPSL